VLVVLEVQLEETTEMLVLIPYFLLLLPLEAVLVLQILGEQEAAQMAVTAALVAVVVIQGQVVQAIHQALLHHKEIMVVMLLPLALIMAAVAAVGHLPLEQMVAVAAEATEVRVHQIQFLAPL